MSSLTRSHPLPFGYRVTFEWQLDPHQVRVSWAPTMPCIKSRRAQRKFFANYAEARTAFLTEVAHLTDGSVLITDAAIGRVELIERPTVN